MTLAIPTARKPITNHRLTQELAAAERCSLLLVAAEHTGDQEQPAAAKPETFLAFRRPIQPGLQEVGASARRSIQFAAVRHHHTSQRPQSGGPFHPDDQLDHHLGQHDTRRDDDDGRAAERAS